MADVGREGFVGLEPVRRPSKSLDLGTGSVCASFDAGSAAWLSIGAPHPGHGFVELTALAPFDEARRGDADATRRHRLAMTFPDSAFLAVELDGALPSLDSDPSDALQPRWTGEGCEVGAGVRTDRRVLEQAWRVRGPVPREVTLRVRGRIDRPALAEITEVDPPAPTGAVTLLLANGAEARAECPALGTRASISVDEAVVAWREEGDALLASVPWPADATELRFSLSVTLHAPGLESGLTAPPAPAHGDPIVERALAYVRGCTALRVASGERAILTDHRILPLSWTRDAYWQALSLLVADEPGDRDRVADHLRWLWRRCERPDGRWVRSHHADGRRKDLAFQADQQLYPLIELADYWRATGSLPDGVDWDAEVSRAWTAATAEADPTTGFVPSDENAADDPAAAPFIAASQILLWYAARRVAELAEAGGLRLDARSLADAARRVRHAFDVHFGATGAWPYAVDLGGGAVAYHDANDLPVALAPLWAFCAPSDPGWRATMAFALSSRNPAWVDGARPGLGSAHTPGAWSLGLLQGWIRARASGDVDGADEARSHLAATAFDDGMLPEAVGPDGEPIRHWFAWPGSAYAALRLLDERGRLESAFAVAP